MAIPTNSRLRWFFPGPGFALGKAVGDGNNWTHWLMWSHGGKMVGKVHGEKGATAIEYGLIAALIAVAAMQSVGRNLKNTFNKVASNMQ